MPRITIKPRSVAGIDPSLGSAAVAIGKSIDEVKLAVFKAGPPDMQVLPRICRWDSHAQSIATYAYKLKPELILLEGYSFGSKGRATLDLAEFGGLLRHKLMFDSHLPNCRLIEVSPSSLKKYITGNGNAKKPQVTAVIARDYKVIYDTDDEYDAYALWLMARAVLDESFIRNKNQEKIIKDLLAGLD